MEDISYLSTEDQQKINDAPIANIAAAITCLSDSIWQEHEDHEDYSCLNIDFPESDVQKLSLIRGLCDRIELKLMETAK